MGIHLYTSQDWSTCETEYSFIMFCCPFTHLRIGVDTKPQTVQSTQSAPVTRLGIGVHV